MAVLLLQQNGTNHLAFTYVAVVVVAIKGTAQHTISFVLSDYRRLCLCLLCVSLKCARAALTVNLAAVNGLIVNSGCCSRTNFFLPAFLL